MNQCLFSSMGSYCERLDNSTVKSNESYGDLVELMVIIGKSLVNDKDQEKLMIDVPRLKEELLLWKYYRRGTINCFLLKNDKGKEHPNSSTGIICILPLIIGNYDFATLEKAIALFAFHTKQNPDHLILSLLMAKVVHGIITREEKNSESLIQFLKEYLIHLSYNRVFQEIVEKNPMDNITFEKEKIQWIMDLDRIARLDFPLQEKYDGDSKIMFIQSLHLFLNHHEEEKYFEVINNSEISLEGKVFSLLLRDFKRNNTCSSTGINLEKKRDLFLNEMDRYFNKLKAFEIIKTFYNPEKMKTIDYTDTKTLFSMDQGQKGKHPIMKNFEVIEKVTVKSHLWVKVKTKSRHYILKKPLALG